MNQNLNSLGSFILKKKKKIQGRDVSVWSTRAVGKSRHLCKREKGLDAFLSSRQLDESSMSLPSLSRTFWSIHLQKVTMMTALIPIKLVLVDRHLSGIVSHCLHPPQSFVSSSCFPSLKKKYIRSIDAAIPSWFSSLALLVLHNWKLKSVNSRSLRSEGVAETLPNEKFPWEIARNFDRRQLLQLLLVYWACAQVVALHKWSNAKKQTRNCTLVNVFRELGGDCKKGSQITNVGDRLEMRRIFVHFYTSWLIQLD